MWEVRWVSVGSSAGLLVFCGPCVFGCISVVVVEGACARDCKGLGMCNVGIVGWSVGDECVGWKGSLVTGWERMRGESESRGREWVRRGRISCWEGKQWILAQEKEGEWRGWEWGWEDDDGTVDSIEKRDNRNRNKDRVPTITKQTKNNVAK
jgi:hypothetical protein